MFFLSSAVLLSIVITTTIIYIFFRRKHLFKGPRGNFLLGSYRDVTPNTFHIKIHEWATLYGDIFSFSMFTKEYVVFSGYEAIYDVLVTKGFATGKAPVHYRSFFSSRGQRDVLYSDTNHPWWLPLRKAFHRSSRLFGDRCAKTEDIFIQATEELMAKWTSYEGRMVDIRQDLTDFTMTAVLILLTGQSSSECSQWMERGKLMADKYLFALGTANFHGVVLDTWPIVRYCGNPVFKSLLEAQHLCDELFEEMREATQKTYKPDQSTCLMHALIELMDKNSSQYNACIDENNLRATFGNVIAASLGTTSSALYAFFNILICHPTVASKLQQEVDTVIGHHRKPTLHDRDKMPYTSAVIYELLRYATIVPIVSHVTSENTVIGGKVIPADTVCLCNIWTLHHDEKLWDEPWVFRPERFLDNNGDLLSPSHPNRKYLLAFGAGPRVCLGELFALRRLFYVIVHALQQFHPRYSTSSVASTEGDSMPNSWSTKHPCVVPCDPRKFSFGIILKPPSYQISFVRRTVP